MKKINKLTNDYQNCINKIESKKLSELEEIKIKIKCTKTYIQKLRILIRNHEFSSIDEEIHFFKNIKPQIAGELRFLKRIQSYLIEKPITSKECHVQFIRKELIKLDDFKQRNINFFKYIRRDDSFYDDKYFVRLLEQLELFNDTDISEIDPEFNTSHDLKAAKVYSYNKLTHFYRKELEKINQEKNKSISNSLVGKNKHQWNATKSDLTELIYALYSSKVINNGELEIKEIANAFENFLDIDLSDIYRTFIDIKSRKINQVRFLNKLEDSLQNRLYELEK